MNNLLEKENCNIYTGENDDIKRSMDG